MFATVCQICMLTHIYIYTHAQTQTYTWKHTCTHTAITQGKIQAPDPIV